MGTAYYDPRSVILRLDRTICFYKGQPVYVEARNATGGLQGDDAHKLDVWDIGQSKKNIQVDYRDTDFSYKAMILGYVNMKDSATYVTRVPSRIQKQGLCRHSLSYTPNPNYTLYNTREMGNMLLNIYPSLEEALEFVQHGAKKACAFHRTFAFRATRPLSLEYRGETIAYLEGKYFRLLDLKESKAIKEFAKEEFGDRLCLL